MDEKIVKLCLHQAELILRSTISEVLPWCLEHYHSCHCRVCCQSSSVAYHIDIQHFSELADKLPAEHGKPCGATLGYAECLFDGRRFYSYRDDHFQHCISFDYTSCALQIWIGNGYVDSRDAFIYNLLRPLVRNFLFLPLQMKVFHGAAVTRKRDGSAFFFPGASGLGKSTTALSLSRTSFSLLGDDSAFFTLNSSGNCEVWPSCEPVRVHSDFFSLFPELMHVKDSRKPDLASKFSLWPDELENVINIDRNPSVLGHLVLLDRIPKGTLSVTTPERYEVFRQLIQELMIPFKHSSFPDSRVLAEWNEIQFSILHSLVMNSRIWHLSFANEDLDEVSHILEELPS